MRICLIILSFIFLDISVVNAADINKDNILLKFENGAYEEYLAKISELAEHGDAIAQFYLGRAFLNGYGMEPNIKLVFELTLKSAKQDNPSAE